MLGFGTLLLSLLPHLPQNLITALFCSVVVVPMPFHALQARFNSAFWSGKVVEVASADHTVPSRHLLPRLESTTILGSRGTSGLCV
jgi:hypothetical protein